MNRYYSHGKLLLTGEYVVLDGATALALPTTYGQLLSVKNLGNQNLQWRSEDHNGQPWFEGKFYYENEILTCSSTNNQDVSDRLVDILNTAYRIAPNVKNKIKGKNIITSLEFPKHWGLGTSSTLINNIAKWLGINPYELLKATFGGSGYDIACASSKSAILFRNIDDQPKVKSVVFDPVFKSHLYFVYLNKKQDSREGIAQYRKNNTPLESTISEIDTLTEAILSSSNLEDFQQYITEHEAIISSRIKVAPIKSRLFSDFNGSIKSLGAWGGDFILVASYSDPRPYFESKGYHTIINYDDMIL